MFKFLKFFTEGIGWLQIALSMLLIGAGAGLIVYGLITNTTGLILAIIVTALGLTIGIVLANRAWKKGGTINLISRVSASPELDNLSSQDENLNNNK